MQHPYNLLTVTGQSRTTCALQAVYTRCCKWLGSSVGPFGTSGLEAQQTENRASQSWRV